MHLITAAINTNGDISGMSSLQPIRAPTHLSARIEGVKTHASTSLLRMSTGEFFLASIFDWRSPRLIKKIVEVALTRGVEDQAGSWLG